MHCPTHAKNLLLALAVVAGLPSTADALVVQQTSYYSDCTYAPVCGTTGVPAVFQVTLSLSDLIVNAAGSVTTNLAAASVQSIVYSWVVGGIDRTTTLLPFAYVTLIPTANARSPFGYLPTDFMSTTFAGGTQVMSFGTNVGTSYSTSDNSFFLINQPGINHYSFAILTAPVLEPGSWAMAVVGLALLAGRVRGFARSDRSRNVSRVI